MFALRTPTHKFIEYYGIWDADELYDLENDPIERTNLFYDEAHQETVRQMRERLHTVMQETGVTSIGAFAASAYSYSLYIPGSHALSPDRHRIY